MSIYNGSSTVAVRLRGLIAQQMSSMAMPTSTLVLVSILQLGNTQTPMPTTFLQTLPVLDAQTLLPMRRVITYKWVAIMVHKEATAPSKRRKRIVEDENWIQLCPGHCSKMSETAVAPHKKTLVTMTHRVLQRSQRIIVSMIANKRSQRLIGWIRNRRFLWQRRNDIGCEIGIGFFSIRPLDDA